MLIWEPLPTSIFLGKFPLLQDLSHALLSPSHSVLYFCERCFLSECTIYLFRKEQASPLPSIGSGLWYSVSWDICSGIIILGSLSSKCFENGKTTNKQANTWKKEQWLFKMFKMFALKMFLYVVFATRILAPAFKPNNITVLPPFYWRLKIHLTH